VLEAVRQKSMMISAYLREAVPTKLVGRELTLAFAPGFVFHKDNLEKPANRQVVEAALESIAGARLQLHLAFGAEAPPPEGPAPSPAEAPEAAPAPPPPASRGGRAQAATQDPSVRTALDVFGARIVNVEE
jgi:hypothetical protein